MTTADYLRATETFREFREFGIRVRWERGVWPTWEEITFLQERGEERWGHTLKAAGQRLQKSLGTLNEAVRRFGRSQVSAAEHMRRLGEVMKELNAAGAVTR